VTFEHYVHIIMYKDTLSTSTKMVNSVLKQNCQLERNRGKR